MELQQQSYFEIKKTALSCGFCTHVVMDIVDTTYDWNVQTSRRFVTKNWTKSSKSIIMSWRRVSLEGHAVMPVDLLTIPIGESPKPYQTITLSSLCFSASTADLPAATMTVVGNLLNSSMEQNLTHDM